jgi:AmmeMemoRadiSam system protein B
MPRSGIALETFETPFGLVRVDQEFAKAIAEKGTIPIDEGVHVPEHSLEVQLPFLQYVFRGSEEKIKIVPVLVSSDIDLNQAAIDIKEAIVDTGRKVCFIVSSDFTHYGADFGYLPFRGEGKELKDQISELDKRAITFIQRGDVEGFAAFLKDTDATICGAYPILLLLKTLKFKEAELKSYYVSGDLTGDYSSSVSYVSMVFRG